MFDGYYELPEVNSLTITDGYLTIDGYIIDPRGALSGQTLIYNPGITSFVPGTPGGGNLSGMFTAGQVAFAIGPGSTTLLQGNSNFFWDDADGYLGIGTGSPSYPLHVVGDGYFTSRTIIKGSSAAVSPGGSGAFRFNSGTSHLEFSENGGAWSQIGVGSVTSVSNSDTTLTISPTTGAVVASLNLGHANTWTTTQTFQTVLPSTTATYSLGSSSAKWQDGYFAGKISLDGYTIDLSAGATTNQVLTYNGTSFVAQNATGGISGTLTSPKVPYATGSSTIADSAMSWDNTNKLLTITTITGNNGVTITDATRNLSLGVTSSVGQVGTTSNHNLVFYTNSNSAQVTLNTSGMFGIGATPSYQLHVAGDGYITSRIIIAPSSAAAISGSGAIRYNTSTSHLEFAENGGSWTQFGSGGGSMTIGGAISGATNNRVLYSDGSSNLGDTILSLTSSELGPVSDNAISIGDDSHRFVDGYFAGKIKLDGYTFDLSAGGTNGQALTYDTGTGTVHFSTVSGGGGGGFGTSGQKIISVIPGGFNANNGTTTPQTVAAFRYNPGDYTLSSTTQSVVFRATAANGSATVAGHVKLRDVTNSVDITTLNVTIGTTADTVFEQTLTVSSPGANTIANSAVIYEVRIYVDSPVNINDFVQLYSAEIRNIQTIN